jgi:hypothetical protein
MPARKGLSLRDLYGGRFMSREVVRRSRIALEKRWTAELREQSRLRARRTELTQKFSAPLRDLMNKDQSAAEAVREMRRLVAASKRNVQYPRTAKIKTGIFGGLGFSATVGPPYDYESIWTAVDGQGRVHSTSADRNTGRMSFNIGTEQGSSSGAVIARAALGIYFYPPINGRLRIWSSPAFNYAWAIACWFARVHADGWIGLLVERFDLAGSSTGAVIAQQVALWSDDAFVYSPPDFQYGSNPGYGLHSADRG